MEEDEAVIVDGIKHCPSCLVGRMEILGGPIGVGLPGIDDPDVLFLFRCDICSHNSKFKDEDYRQDLLLRYPTPEDRLLRNRTET